MQRRGETAPAHHLPLAASVSQARRKTSHIESGVPPAQPGGGGFEGLRVWDGEEEEEEEETGTEKDQAA